MRTTMLRRALSKNKGKERILFHVNGIFFTAHPLAFAPELQTSIVFRTSRRLARMGGMGVICKKAGKKYNFRMIVDEIQNTGIIFAPEKVKK